jgi:hypothetical protein
MSASKRLLWIIPAVLVAFWMAFRSMAAVPAPERQADERDGRSDRSVPAASPGWSAGSDRSLGLGEPLPPVAVTGAAIADRTLAQRISGFAARARVRD